MRTERFTTRTQEAILAAQQLAEGEGHPELTAAHLLLSLIDQPDGVVPAVLERAGRDPAAIAQALRERLSHLPRVSGEGTQLSLSNEARDVLTGAHAARVEVVAADDGKRQDQPSGNAAERNQRQPDRSLRLNAHRPCMIADLRAPRPKSALSGGDEFRYNRGRC